MHKIWVLRLRPLERRSHEGHFCAPVRKSLTRRPVLRSEEPPRPTEGAGSACTLGKTRRRPTYTRPFDLSSQIQKVSVTDESSVVSMTTLELTVPS